MPKNHLKPQSAPKTWVIKRKNVKYVTRPHPGAHLMELSMPLNLVFKNLLQTVKTNKEVKKILHEQEILVDGKPRKDHKYSMGLLDVLSITKTKENFVMLINEQNKLSLQPIDKKDSTHKISKITGKKCLKKGAIQLKTLDGRVIVVKKDNFKTGDSVLLSLPKQEVEETLKFEKGATILLFKGKYAGAIATISEIKDKILVFKKDSKEFETKKEYAIVIGKDKPVIKITN
ncbi:MAG: 30S ribosomal protein S4e [archaeon]